MNNAKRHYLEGQYLGTDRTFRIQPSKLPGFDFEFCLDQLGIYADADLLTCLQMARNGGPFEVTAMCDRLAFRIVESLHNFT